MTADAFVHWLDLHRWIYFTVAGGLAATALVVAVLGLLRGANEEVKRHDGRWGLMILALLLVGRWPTFLVTREINPDESQLLAGARALVDDPVFWRSVDAGSSGPLNFFVLWPAGWLFNWQGYLPSRCTALALLAITLTLAHQCLALVVGRRVARAAILGAVCLEAFTNTLDFLHYSTELLPMTLLTGAVYCAVRRWVHGGGPGWNALGAVLLGAVPLTKLQGIPSAAILGAGWVLAEFLAPGPQSGRRRLYLIAGALVPVALFAFQITVAGEWRNVIVPYFDYNLSYTEKSPLNYAQLVQMALAISLDQDSLIHLWVGGSLAWMLVMIRRRQSADRATRWFTLLAVTGVPLACWSALYPHRPFLHYWQFVVVPGALAVGALTGNMLTAPDAPWSRTRRRLAAAATVALVGLLLGRRALHPDELVGPFDFFRRSPHRELSNHVAAFARPGDTIAIWGWSSWIYVETGLPQAARDAHFERAVEPGPFQDYFRERFLADVMHAKPALFLDSVGPSSLHYVKRRFAHDQNYPDLAAVIRRDYVLVDEFEEARLYRRRDPAAP